MQCRLKPARRTADSPIEAQSPLLAGNDMLERAPHDLAGWTAYFRDAEIPVLPRTIRALNHLRAGKDAASEEEEDHLDDIEVDAHTLAGIVGDDPLMMLKVLSYVASHRSSRVVTDLETITAAILLMGVPPFFRVFKDLTGLETRLAPYPGAMQGLARVMRRSYRAATFALAFAVHRADADAEVIHEAALLHDFAELLLWCHAPSLALEIQSRQRADPTLRSSVVQQEILHIHLGDLQQSLMRQWRLPELLVTISDDRRAHEPRVRNVLLAVQLARHTQDGWENPALPDDLAAIGGLLNLSPEAVRRKVRSVGD
jgi:HD-like signal output (HDOD) protein